MNKFYIVYCVCILAWFFFLYGSGTRLGLADAGAADKPTGSAARFHK